MSSNEFALKQQDFLLAMANKYIWWEQAETAVKNPLRVLAQLMDIGVFEDTQQMRVLFSESQLVEVINQAAAGYFRPKSWHYWHYVLNLTQPGEEVPPLPQRAFYTEQHQIKISI